jgi:PAS domain S-box-containing protein
MNAISNVTPAAGVHGSSPENSSMDAQTSLAFLSGGGELGALVRGYDWSKNPLGLPQQWPQSLRMAVSMCLSCSFPIVIWWGRELILIYNDAYTSILGNKHPQALGQRGEDCWREVWPLVGPMLERVLDQAKPFTADDLQLMVWRHGYFEECYFYFSYSPIYEENGGVSGVFCPVIETTDKIVGARRLETLRELAALRRAETVKGACQQAIAVLAKNGRDVPFAYLYLLSEDGHSASLMGGTDGCADGSELPLAQFTKWPLVDVRDEALVLENLVGKHLPTGVWSEAPQQVYLAPIILPGSQRARAILVAGASPHKRLDKAYRSFFELLVAQVGSTIADTLAYEAERKRAEALAEIDRAKTLFFSNISHEFRTPLTLMLGPLEDALSGSELSITERERLDIARRNSLRLLKLVNSLLDFSRIEAGRAQASYEPTDLATLTIDLASNFRSACEKVGLKLAVDCPAICEPTYVDRDMWEKIVLNLLSNAFKFTLEGEIAVSLRTVGGQAELCVRDTGVGVPQRELPRLFERFHRIEGQKSRTHEGSGIGLALVQELVKLHGGTIRADSEVGRGTTFAVRIPFGTAHLAKDRIGVERSLSSTSIRADAYVQEALRWLPGAGEPLRIDPSETLSLSQGARIIVADDNADMRAYVRGLLGAHVEVETVADGEAALDAIRRCHPDLVLADVMMPGLDGFGLLHAIRADEKLRELPVILVSARAGQESEIEGLAAGADDYLVKPFAGRELLARITAHLGLSRIRREATQALRDNEALLRSALQAARMAYWAWNPTNDEIVASKTANELFGLMPDEEWHSRQQIFALLHPEDRESHQELVERCGEEGKGWHSIFRIIRPRDGQIAWLEERTEPLRNAMTAQHRITGLVWDITEQEEAVEHQRVLLAELQHRVRNILAVMRSIVRRSNNGERSAEEYARHLDGRVTALARTQILLTRKPGAGVNLDEIVRDELIAQAASEEQFSIEGPDLELAPKAAEVLALAVHELATNATKYGALAKRNAHIDIRWSVDAAAGESWLRFKWTERGVRIADRAVQRHGFGTELISRRVPYELRGRGGLSFTPDGVHCSIEFPLAAADSILRVDGVPRFAGRRHSL